MARRRKIVGTSLLTASATLVLASCGGTATGNLVAPPMVELCVTATPDTAIVTIDETTPDEAGCLDLFEGTHIVRATADGFQDYEEGIEVYDDTHHGITLAPVTTTQ